MSAVNPIIVFNPDLILTGPSTCCAGALEVLVDEQGNVLTGIL